MSANPDLISRGPDIATKVLGKNQLSPQRAMLPQPHPIPEEDPHTSLHASKASLVEFEVVEEPGPGVEEVGPGEEEAGSGEEEVGPGEEEEDREVEPEPVVAVTAEKKEEEMEVRCRHVSNFPMLAPTKKREL